jgi:predicted N-acetyltransferase YhbS
MLIRPTGAPDAPCVSALVDRCFGPARRGRTACLLRGKTEPVLAFVAEASAQIIGSVACHPVLWSRGGQEPRPLILLGPLAVAPERAGEGIGRALLARTVEMLDLRREDCMLIGDEPYYSPFGFFSAPTKGWQLPGPVEPERLLLRAAEPARWAGPARLRAVEWAGPCAAPLPEANFRAA